VLAVGDKKGVGDKTGERFCGEEEKDEPRGERWMVTVREPPDKRGFDVKTKVSCSDVGVKDLGVEDEVGISFRIVIVGLDEGGL